MLIKTSDRISEDRREAIFLFAVNADLLAFLKVDARRLSKRLDQISERPPPGGLFFAFNMRYVIDVRYWGKSGHRMGACVGLPR